MKPRIAATLCAILTLVLARGALGLDDARSRFAELVLAKTYPAATTSSRPIELRWNLRDRRQVLYRIEQSELQTTTQRLDGASRTFEREAEAKGTMVVFSHGDGSPTEVRVQDLTTETTVRAGAKTESVTARLPVVVAAGLTETGRIDPGSQDIGPSPIDNLVTGLFALPEAALAAGGSAEVPVRFGAAVQWGQSRERMKTYPVVVEGRALVTLTGRERVGRCDCARLDIVFDLSSSEPPEGFPGEIRVVVRGSARTWFDTGAARLAEGALAMALGIDLGAPDRPKDAGMTIITDTHTRVRIGR